MTQKQIAKMHAQLLAGLCYSKSPENQQMLNTLKEFSQELENDIWLNVLAENQDENTALAYDNIAGIFNLLQTDRLDLVKQSLQKILEQYYSRGDKDNPFFLAYSHSLHIKYWIMVSLTFYQVALPYHCFRPKRIDLAKSKQNLDMAIETAVLFRKALFYGLAVASPYDYERNPVAPPLNFNKLEAQGLYKEPQHSLDEVSDKLIELSEKLIYQQQAYREPLYQYLSKPNSLDTYMAKFLQEIDQSLSLQQQIYQNLYEFLCIIMQGLLDDPLAKQIFLNNNSYASLVGIAEVIAKETFYDDNTTTFFYFNILNLVKDKYEPSTELIKLIAKQIEHTQELEQNRLTIAHMLLVLKEQVQLNPDVPLDGQSEDDDPLQVLY